MKLTHLLAQYLYKNKQLDLQGIGSFLLDNTIAINPDDDKPNKEAGIEGVSFENNQSVIEDPALITFISHYTGKIKALASADLNSHLELAKQFLNIGKPFLFEGIGSLTKIRSGEYTFVPGNALTEKLVEKKKKESSKAATNEEPVSDYKSALYKTATKSNWKKPVTFTIVILGIALAIWGGYTVYKRTSPENNGGSKPELAKDKTIVLEDSLVSKNDSQDAASKTKSSTTDGTAKFVLEVSDKDRAYLRYSRLKTFQWDVRMETKDSVSFKIFMLLPVIAADTSRILDSLSMLSGKRVYIEK